MADETKSWATHPELTISFLLTFCLSLTGNSFAVKDFAGALDCNLKVPCHTSILHPNNINPICKWLFHEEGL